MMLLAISTMFSEEFQIIQRSEDGRWYLTDETVVALANYIKKLEELNENYKKQIETLESIKVNLEQQVETLKAQVEELKQENSQLQSELRKYQIRDFIYKVVAAITIGGVVYLFVTMGGE